MTRSDDLSGSLFDSSRKIVLFEQKFFYPDLKILTLMGSLNSSIFKFFIADIPNIWDYLMLIIDQPLSFIKCGTENSLTICGYRQFLDSNLSNGT